ncbi:MAG: phosphatase PAP2 family protein [Actinomycetia bacterium]|nr:phosphatase PAP2 family protein [Actinomycetes bacterium]MCP4957999.1 phosphatase PAP2 family protein [Actinomycetes bacterium]
MKATTTHRSSPFLAVRTRVEAPTVVVVVVVAAVIVVASSAIAWDGTVPDWEARPLRWINGWPDWFEPAMWFLQQVGALIAPVVAGLIVVLSTRRWQHLIPFVLVLPLKLGIEKAVVKQLVDRERPFVSLGPDINVRGPAFEGLSFPSGHGTTAFALAVLLTAFVPSKWRFVPITWATIVLIARMYYGEHNLLDVVAGAALGTAFATVLWFVFLNRDVPEECG